MIDALGDVGGALKRAQPDSLVKLYRDLGLEVSYRRREDGGVATIALRVVNERVRGGTCSLMRSRELGHGCEGDVLLVLAEQSVQAYSKEAPW